MNRQQVIQLIIFALFIGASGIGWILRRIGEQAQRRAAEQALERRRLELLRTGRDPGLSSPQARGTIGPARVSAGGELTVAERRQRQLEELRRRQLARSQGQAGSQGGVASPSRDSRRIGEAQVRVPDMNAAKTGRGSPAGRQGTARTPAPLGPSPSSQSFPGRSPSRTPTGRVPEPGRPGAGAQDVEAARREALRRHQERLRRTAEEQARRAEASRKAGSAFELQEGESSTRQLLGESIASESAYAIDRSIPAAATLTADGRRRSTTPPILVAGTELTFKDWRRAIIVNEVLGKPVSLRDDPTPYTPD